MKRSKKGFTLIELLSVIVVLAIIALIAVPLVVNLVETSKRSAFERSVINASKAVDYYLHDNGIDELPNEGVHVKTLALKGNLKSGKFTTGEDNLVVEYVTDGVYCAYGPIDNFDIGKDCSSLDATAPILDSSKLIVNSTSSTVTVTILEGFAIDPESGIKEYKIEIYNGEEKIDEISANEIGSYQFDKLIKDQPYNIKITVINGKNLKTDVEKEVSTKNINTPTYNVVPQGWAQSKNVEIIYDEGLINEYSIDGGESWIPYVEILDLSENVTIIARINDGTNYVTASSQSVTGIDTTAPTKSTFSYTRTSKSITVIASGEDLESDIYGYRFSNDGGLTWTDIQTSNVYTFDNLVSGAYDVKVRAINGTYINNGENTKSYLDSESQTVDTVEIPKPTYEVTPEGWATSKTVKITYPDGYTNEYSVDDGKTWNPYTGEISFTQNGTVIGRVNDGKNYVEGTSQTVSGIDTVTPSVSISATKTGTTTTVGSNSWSNKGLDFTLTKVTSGDSGYTIYYCKDTNNTCSPTTQATSGTKITTYSGTTGTYYIRYYIKSGAGKSSEIKSYTAKIDTVTPSVSISATKTGTATTVGSNSWSNKGLDFTLTKVTSGDSGYTIYYCKDTNNTCSPTTQTTSGTKITAYSGTTGTYYIRYYIKSGAGSSSSVVSYTAKIDTIAPECTWSGESTSWRTSGTITATCADTGGSGCSASNKWEYTSGTTTSISTKSLSYTFTDGAGNSATCSKTANVYVDRKPPTCTWSGESTSWRQSGTIKATCADTGGSGCSTGSYSWPYTSGNTTSISTKALSYTFKDAVGNSATCSKTANVYVDNKPPTCTWSGESTSWRQSGTIKATCADTGGSGCSTGSYSWPYTSGNTTSISTKALSYTFKDAVGNSATCSKTANVYVDNKPPTCYTKLSENSTWRNTDFTASVACADTGGSGCTQSTFSKKFTTSTKTGTVQLVDNVGNTQNCTVNVYVDKTGPTIGNVTISPTFSTWTERCNAAAEMNVSLTASDAHSGIGISNGKNVYMYWNYLNNSGKTFASDYPKQTYDSDSSFTVSGSTYSIKSTYRGGGKSIVFGVCDNVSNCTTVTKNIYTYCNSDSRFTYSIVTK